MRVHVESSIDDNHIRKFPPTSISTLSPYTGLILSVVLLVLFLIKFYVLELFLLRKIYGTKYTKLDEVNRRGFVNHHIAGGTKMAILVIAVYPFGAVVFGKAGFHTPFAHGSTVTMGDILVVVAQMLVGMFLFELIYRTKISPISVVHHMASILVAQAAITISVSANKDSSIEFLLCLVWGAFDIICEMLPHITIIAYRVYPDSHRFLATIFRAASITTFIGTVSETVVTMYFFGQLWSRWTLPFKILTPVLHVAFSAAQFHGTRIFFKLWRKQERIIRDQRDAEKEMGEENASSETISARDSDSWHRDTVHEPGEQV
ncbi:hypothetical protein DFH07DRAFT_999071 [Mycena maculata]|uniref:TLC domain-containing protein n=1 Tax=Mycena maculata TaxID=230809 RepID=A0AAD7HVC9_9AGAR|nr:hypothetical protein DFH07DRAFT_999071 [Mycena maculata]